MDILGRLAAILQGKHPLCLVCFHTHKDPSEKVVVYTVSKFKTLYDHESHLYCVDLPRVSTTYVWKPAVK